MSLNIQNNNYAGMLAEGISHLISIGANDYTLWQTKTTNGSKIRFSYVDAAIVVQDITSSGLCALTDEGDLDLDFMNVDLVALATVQSVCIDALWDTDFANAGGVGYQNQSVDAKLVAAWGGRMVDKFSKELQRARWSGTIAGATGTTGTMDGIVTQIKALGAYNAVSNVTGYQKVATTTVTAVNVIDEMKKVIAALPFEVKAHKGFKLVVAPGVANFLQQAVMTPTGVTNMVLLTPDLNTGKLTDNFFGFKVYVADGLNDPQVTGNNNIIIGAIFEDSDEGVIKWGANKPSDERDIQIKEVSDGDKVRMRIISAQGVTVIPNGSQIAMNA